MYIDVLLAGGLISVASLIGVVTTNTFFRAVVEKNIRYFVSFAIGVFGVLVYTLAEEIIHEASIGTLLLFGSLGFFAFALFTGVFTAHHHHGATDHGHSHIDARRMLLGDGLHNIGDGILLVPLFAANPLLGGAGAIGILVHEMVQEIAEFFVLREAGLSVARALLLNFVTALSIFIGIGIGILIVDIENILIPLLSFSAGGFSYIIIKDLTPSVLTSLEYECKPLPHLLFFVSGVALMILVSLGHGH